MIIFTYVLEHITWLFQYSVWHSFRYARWIISIYSYIDEKLEVATARSKKLGVIPQAFLFLCRKALLFYLFLSQSVFAMLPTYQTFYLSISTAICPPRLSPSLLWEKYFFLSANVHLPSISICDSGMPVLIRTALSVSYTHLDVYKRQPEHHLSCYKNEN